MDSVVRSLTFPLRRADCSDDHTRACLFVNSLCVILHKGLHKVFVNQHQSWEKNPSDSLSCSRDMKHSRYKADRACPCMFWQTAQTAGDKENSAKLNQSCGWDRARERAQALMFGLLHTWVSVSCSSSFTWERFLNKYVFPVWLYFKHLDTQK